MKLGPLSELEKRNTKFVVVIQFSYLENTFISLKLEIINSINMFTHALSNSLLGGVSKFSEMFFFALLNTKTR